MPKSKKTPTPCECSLFEAIDPAQLTETNLESGSYAAARTGCPGTATSRTFAPGHDAKLKGLLIRAGVAGHEIHGMGLVASPIAIAARYGFEQMVRKGIAGGLVKAEIRNLKKGQRSELAEAAQARQAARASEVAASRPEPECDDEEWANAHTDEDKARYADPSEPQIVSRKVGRWVYEGTIKDGVFTYTDKKGETKITTMFTRV